MPKSFLVKKASRNKRKLAEDIHQGKYLYCYTNAPESTWFLKIKGQSCFSAKKL